MMGLYILEHRAASWAALALRSDHGELQVSGTCVQDEKVSRVIMQSNVQIQDKRWL